MRAAYDFADRVVLVTGGRSGIGREAVKRFAAAGAAVVIASRTAADMLAGELRTAGARVLSVRADVSDEQDVQRAVRQAVEAFGTIDILVNCAGVTRPGTLEEISLAEWDHVLRNNLTSQFLCCKHVVPLMKERRFGKIVNVSSISARSRSSLSGVHYVVSKTAILGLTRQLAYELAKFGINVNAVCPGQTRTLMLESVLPRGAESALEMSIPMGRIAKPEEMAEVILFLASEAAGYMTGAILDVNGGQW